MTEYSLSIRSEGEHLEVQFGTNAYSDYLKKHGRLPDPATAVTIGRLVDGRVKADDGRLYPALTKADRERRRAARARRKAWERECRLRRDIEMVLYLLADTAFVPEEVAALGGFDRAEVDSAVGKLRRFASAQAVANDR